jgi:hypothetical protein
MNAPLGLLRNGSAYLVGHFMGDSSDGVCWCKSRYYAKALDTIRGQKEEDGGLRPQRVRFSDVSSTSCDVPRSAQLSPLSVLMLHLFR